MHEVKIKHAKKTPHERFLQRRLREAGFVLVLLAAGNWLIFTGVEHISIWREFIHIRLQSVCNFPHKADRIMGL